MALLKQVDWNGNEAPYTAMDLARHEQRVARVRAEVGELRSAVHAMRAQGGAFLDEVAAFLDRETQLLERANEADGTVDLGWKDDTPERDGYVPTSARSALLITRAFTQQTGKAADTDRTQEAGDAGRG
ncbi:hypothetical protein [Actinomadura rudentiformis]|uniref:Uncharacterized protein n=1 Tax=Actinomadura rudentiformis TaxID=359158 RepID=A0A6H9YVR1_9ACTN|nr:hypothetical protein [Actinomadura rudentiformis]KAB2350067.1 hypothetical protein F8566_09615 [Actinomadura rudentiformis]